MTDFFEPLTDSAAIERIPVTTASDTPWLPSPGGRKEQDEALVGTLVHRLFQFAEGTDGVSELAARLVRPEERATAADAAASVGRALDAWTAMSSRPEVARLLSSGERIHELPFSYVAPGQPGRVLRGTIDCLVRQPDGSIVVIEFKTGVSSPAHTAQLELYVGAARDIFPGTPVSGVVVYPP